MTPMWLDVRTAHPTGTNIVIRYGVIGTAMMGAEHIENISAIEPHPVVVG